MNNFYLVTKALSGLDIHQHVKAQESAILMNNSTLIKRDDGALNERLIIALKMETTL